MAGRKSDLAESAVLNPSVVLDNARGFNQVVVLGVKGDGKVVVAGSHGYRSSKKLIEDGLKTIVRMAGG